jgi:uncharacterized protein with PIN domain
MSVKMSSQTRATHFHFPKKLNKYANVCHTCNEEIVEKKKRPKMLSRASYFSV